MAERNVFGFSLGEARVRDSRERRREEEMRAEFWATAKVCLWVILGAVGIGAVLRAAVWGNAQLREGQRLRRVTERREVEFLEDQGFHLDRAEYTDGGATQLLFSGPVSVNLRRPDIAGSIARLSHVTGMQATVRRTGEGWAVDLDGRR
jgi:hypothetical protein